ncbi:MAG: type-F conjugative transfer system secretin TraK [Helicobacteraceae bacterium]|jgi:hypothetical protein|nr:type-F conjugative transfer system secretin TraK [Helicobacteraceae bacterium]
MRDNALALLTALIKRTIVCAIVFAAPLIAAAPQIITDPVGTITLKLSRTDQNVIEMPNPIISKHYSQEKDIQVDTIGHRAIIKFLPSVRQQYEVVNNQQTPVGEPEISYAKVKPADLVLITSDNAIYTFKVIPSDTALKTVIIRSTAANLKEALAYETASPYQETLGKLAKAVFQAQTPSGYRVVENGSKKWRIASKDANMTITLLKTYKGALYDIHLLNVYNRDNTERRYDGQLLFSIAEKISPKNPARAVSWYYGNYAHVALPKSYVKAIIIVEGGGNNGK